jgi:RNA 2',3'-cyclic 3'-phosphodiesterase
MMKRLFFALWPSDATRQKIIEFDELLIDPRLKKVSTKNLHVTLVFLGLINEKQEQQIIEAANNISASSINMQFDQLTFWQQKRGILSLTSASQPEYLLTLVKQLQNRVIEKGIEIEQRPYTAHITLARNLKQPPEIKVEAIPWHSDKFVLVHSVSTKHGVDYQIINSWPLLPS